MNGSLGTLPPSSVPSSLSSAVTSPEDERRCALFSVGDEHAAVSRAASPAPIKVLLSTLVGSCPLPGLLWLAEAWSVIIERVSLSVLRDPMPGRWEGEPSSASQIRGGRLAHTCLPSMDCLCAVPHLIGGIRLRMRSLRVRRSGRKRKPAERVPPLSRFRDLLPPRHRRAAQR